MSQLAVKWDADLDGLRLGWAGRIWDGKIRLQVSSYRSSQWSLGRSNKFKKKVQTSHSTTTSGEQVAFHPPQHQPPAAKIPLRNPPILSSQSSSFIKSASAAVLNSSRLSSCALQITSKSTTSNLPLLSRPSSLSAYRLCLQGQDLRQRIKGPCHLGTYH